MRISSPFYSPAIAAFALFLIGLSPSAAQDAKTILQQGLFAEEAEQKLDKAAASYEQIIETYNQQREFAVAALFRLAEVRRKQKRNADAATLYQRILSEFPNAEHQARLSRENLLAMGIEVAKPSTVIAAKKPVDPEEERELRRLMMVKANKPESIDGKVPTFEIYHKQSQIGSIHTPASKGWTRVVEWLLDEGVPVDHNPKQRVSSNRGIGYPLSHAARNGQLEVCQLLLKRGAKIEQAAKIFVKAVAENNSPLANWFIENGADINTLGQASLEATDGSTKFITRKIDGVEVKRYEPNLCGFTGTALSAAIAGDDKIWMDRLLELKAKPNVEKETLSALHIACLKGHLPLVSITSRARSGSQQARSRLRGKRTSGKCPPPPLAGPRFTTPQATREWYACF